MSDVNPIMKSKVPLIIGSATVGVAVVIAAINPFRGPLETENASAQTTLGSEVLAAIQIDTCNRLEVAVRSVSTALVEQHAAQLDKAAEMSVVSATKFAEANPWLKASASPPNLLEHLRKLAAAPTKAAIQKKNPNLASDWLTYQTANFSKQITESKEFATSCAATLADAEKVDSIFSAFEEKRSKFVSSIYASGPDADSTSLSPAACREIRIGAGIAEQVLLDSEMKPSQAAELLKTSSDTFSKVATIAHGSERDWLERMASLESDVGSYVLTGTPSDGQVKAAQLTNNLGLESQFCPN